VLAIGQNLQPRNNEKFLVGPNATLELTPQQAENIALAQRVAGSTLSLALRGIADKQIVDMDVVLIAEKELGFGHALQDGDLQWQRVPKDNILPNFVRKSTAPHAIAELKGMITRNTFYPGDPIQQDRLVKPDPYGFMADITIIRNGIATQASAH
jgi:Flp pilus assembly protein CpaB